MGFDAATPNSLIPIGSFRSTVGEGIAITPGNYLDCSSRAMV